MIRKPLLPTLLAVALAAPLAHAQTAKAAPGRIDDAMLRNASKNGDDWISYGFTPGETRYSPLNQINASNVSRLGVAWSFDVGKGGGGQGLIEFV